MTQYSGEDENYNFICLYIKLQNRVQFWSYRLNNLAVERTYIMLENSRL